MRSWGVLVKAKPDNAENTEDPGILPLTCEAERASHVGSWRLDW